MRGLSNTTPFIGTCLRNYAISIWGSQSRMNISLFTGTQEFVPLVSNICSVNWHTADFRQVYFSSSGWAMLQCFSKFEIFQGLGNHRRKGHGHHHEHSVPSREARSGDGISA